MGDKIKSCISQLLHKISAQNGGAVMQRCSDLALFLFTLKSKIKGAGYSYSVRYLEGLVDATRALNFAVQTPSIEKRRNANSCELVPHAILNKTRVYNV